MQSFYEVRKNKGAHYIFHVHIEAQAQALALAQLTHGNYQSEHEFWTSAKLHQLMIHSALCYRSTSSMHLSKDQNVRVRPFPMISGVISVNSAETLKTTFTLMPENFIPQSSVTEDVYCIFVYVKENHDQVIPNVWHDNNW